MIKVDYSNLGQALTVDSGTKKLHAVVCQKPFYDPNKSLTKN
jgi:glycine cleavage system aminomethyltransferase T